MSVPLPPSTGFVAQDSYVLRNALNYSNESVPGTYDGLSLKIDTDKWSVAPPIGSVPDITSRPSPYPLFGVFILERVPNAGSTKPGAPGNLRLVGNP